MDKYNQATAKALEYITAQKYCSTIISENRSCFSGLAKYLITENISYSPEAANMWFDSEQDRLSASTAGSYRLALLRLEDFYTTGSVDKEHDARYFLSYSVLEDGLKGELDEFLLSLRGTYAQATINGYRKCCARFMIYLQRMGIHSVSNLSHEVLISFYNDDVHRGNRAKGQVNGKVTVFLIHFYQKGILPFGMTRILHHLSAGKGAYWNDVNESVHSDIREKLASDHTENVTSLVSYRNDLRNCLIENGYSKNVVAASIRGVELLILFLEMNGYHYSESVAMLWFNGCRDQFGSSVKTIRRALLLIAGLKESGKIDVTAFFREKTRAFSLLPEWCREAAFRYEKYKIQEGWESSTLDMIRSSICRFCGFIDSIGIRSFSELDASHIKRFNEQDIHKTPAGKNAYNNRIRKFLIFLGDEGYLSNPMLFAALTCTYAPQETIVVVLTKEEMSQMNEALYSENSVLSLRKKAMLLLGLKMGMRSSDIVNLDFNSINWEKASIRFVQNKTQVEVDLPMPDAVGNALFRYITEERGKSSSQKVFLSQNAPHKPVGRSVCGCALNTALPDRKVDGSGFHVTRRTYATELLRSGVGANTVADALGQRGNSSVLRYLSLDSERMAMCALSLDEYGIGGWKYGK